MNKGMLYARLNLAEYNKNAIDELEVEDIVKAAIDEQRKKTLLAAHDVKTRKERITGSLCGAIMIIATIAGLVMLFQPIAQGMDPDDVNWTANMFWMAWVIGGIVLRYSSPPGKRVRRRRVREKRMDFLLRPTFTGWHIGAECSWIESKRNRPTESSS